MCNSLSFSRANSEECLGRRIISTALLTKSETIMWIFGLILFMGLYIANPIVGIAILAIGLIVSKKN